MTIRASLRLDAAAEAERLCREITRQVAELRRRGAVVAMSGGVDSSTCAALAARALGPGRVLGLMLPEREGGANDRDTAVGLAEQLGIDHLVEPIGSTLEAAGCYSRRDEAIHELVPDYGEGWRSKIGLGGGDRTKGRAGIVYYLTVQSPQGRTSEHRLSAAQLRQIMAATNFKQRVRKMFEYYHAERLHYAVVGTPNRLEYDQGFFVKGGDGLADIKPIGHLYKCQVIQLAEYLGVPEAIRSQVSTTATYSLPQTQEEFYFALPLADFDVALAGHERGESPVVVAAELGLDAERVAGVYRDIERRRETARYLHHVPSAPAAIESRD